MFNRLLGYLVTFLMIFLVVDGLFRVRGCGPKPSMNEFHANWGWQNSPDTETDSSTSEFDVTFRVNSKGLRGPEVEYDKPAGSKRILFVGDSFTLGYTVDEEDLFLRILEADLNGRDHQVEALNAGVQGYSNDQELVWLMDEGLKYRPDYVVLAPYLNDVAFNSVAAYTNRQKPLFSVEDGALTRTNPLLENPGDKPWWAAWTAIGNVAYMMKMAGLLPKIRTGGTSVFLEYAPLLKAEPPKVTEAWQITEAIVKQFGDVVREAGATPVGLLIPTKWEIHDDFESPRELGRNPPPWDPARPTDRYAKILEDAGFLVVDPRAALTAKANEGERLYHRKDWHWNEAGNRVVAAALLDRFVQADLLGPGSGAAVASPDNTSGSSSGGGVPTWMFVVGALWLILGTFFWRSTAGENPLGAYLKVLLLISFVVGVFLGIGKLVEVLPAAAAIWVMPALILLILGFILWKAGKRLALIGELYGTFLRRGHWYALPMLIVMLSIGMLLVVAASSPFVAPFIYTLF